MLIPTQLTFELTPKTCFNHEVISFGRKIKLNRIFLLKLGVYISSLIKIVCSFVDFYLPPEDRPLVIITRVEGFIKWYDVW